jgi:hypothetical protein
MSKSEASAVAVLPSPTPLGLTDVVPLVPASELPADAHELTDEDLARVVGGLDWSQIVLP